MNFISSCFLDLCLLISIPVVIAVIRYQQLSFVHKRKSYCILIAKKCPLCIYKAMVYGKHTDTLLHSNHLVRQTGFTSATALKYFVSIDSKLSRAQTDMQAVRTQSLPAQNNHLAHHRIRQPVSLLILIPRIHVHLFMRRSCKRCCFQSDDNQDSVNS